MRQIDVLRFWLPLFASWLLLTAEGPLVSAAVNRLPDEVVMLAALGVVYSLSILIESPIINLLATGTALVDDRASFELVRRFTLHWIVLLTGISVLLAYTPLFDLVVSDVLAIPDDVAEPVRPGLQIMVLWTAAVAWRRFLQGVMIRFHRTRRVGWGTFLRLVTIVGVATGLVTWGRLPGIHMATIALMAGVVAEALFATWAVRAVLREDLPEVAPGGEAEPLHYRSLLAFHLPLAGTGVLTLLIQPMVSFALARLDRPTLTLAAWPIVLQFALVMRAGALALPEVIIALAKNPEHRPALKRFTWSLTGLSLAGMLVFCATPLVDLYLFAAQNAAPEIAELARLGFWLFVPMPAIVTLISWRRGLLMERRETRRVNRAMMVRLGIFTVVLAVGIALRWPGIPLAAWATNLSVAAELLVLSRRSGTRAPAQTDPASRFGRRTKK